MFKDIRGYYTQLEVAQTANANEIKLAYRRLAKIHHPDNPLVTDRGARFKLISAAYEVLSSPEQRANYDSACATQPEIKPSAQIEPISCSRCNKITAQPRYVVFMRVFSVILATYRQPIQGIYCAACAKKAAFQATLISAVAGWWGFPWGPIWTVKEGIKNAFGGLKLPESEEKLLFHNALAFASRGDLRLSLALANRLHTSKNSDIAGASSELIAYLKSQGAESNGTLRDSWSVDWKITLGQLAMIAALPGAFLAAIAASDAGHSSRTPYTPNPIATVGQLTPTSAATSPAVITKTTSAPTCARDIENGEILAGESNLNDQGHKLEIDNGSQGNAIVKVKKAGDATLLASFFVKDGTSATLSGIPDGSYNIQYGIGDQIAVNCKSFVNSQALGQFPDTETFVTRREPSGDMIRITHSRLSYTLYAVPSGNVRPMSIDPKTFDAN